MRLLLVLTFLFLFQIRTYADAIQDSIQVERCGSASLRLVYSNPDSSKALIDQALILCEKSGGKPLTAMTYNYLGIYYDVIGNNDSALWAYNRALQMAEESERFKTVASAYNNIGLLYWNNKELTNALTHFFKASEIYRELDDQKGLANTYSNIGLIFQEQKRIEKGLKYAREALSIRQALRDSINIGKSYANIGILLGMSGQSDSDFYYSKLALQYFHAKNDKYNIGSSYQNLSTSAHIMDDLDTAIYYAQRALTVRLEIGNKKHLASTYNLLGNLYHDAKQFEQSEEAYLAAIQIYEKYDQQRQSWRCYRRIARLYSEWGKYQLATEYMLKHSNLGDSINGLDRTEKLYEVEAKYETERRKRELAEKEVALKEQARKSQVLGLSVALLVLLITMVVVIFRQRIEKSKAAKTQALQEQKLDISRELHDNIGSQLTYLNLNLEMVKKLEGEKREHKIGDLQRFARQTMNDLRTSIWGLSRETTSNDLQSKIADEVQKASSEKTKVTISSTIDQNEIVPSQLAINTLRIAQEAIQNAIKHSGASEINVEFVYDGTIQLTVQDNGIGIQSTSEGFGLSFMRQRADKIGADLIVESAENGTRVSLRVE